LARVENIGASVGIQTSDNIVSDLIDNMSFPSLNIDKIVAYKYFFTWKKCRVTASVLLEMYLPVTLMSH